MGEEIQNAFMTKYPKEIIIQWNMHKSIKM